MKAVRRLVLLLSLVGLVAASYASSSEKAYIDTCRKGPNVPVPVTVVSPTVGAEYAGDRVELEFIVEPSGKPANLTVKSASDDTLASLVMEAVKGWRFKPAEHNGVPVATRVVLPVKVVEPEDSVFAANN